MAYKYIRVSAAYYTGDLPEVNIMVNSGEPIDVQSITKAILYQIFLTIMYVNIIKF